jgi:hypothetical protein
MLSALAFVTLVSLPPMSPVKCAMVADMLYMLIRGQALSIPEEYYPYLEAAAAHYVTSGKKEPYYHSTTFFLECIRTRGDVSRMYDPRHLVDPTKNFVSA